MTGAAEGKLALDAKVYRSSEELAKPDVDVYIHLKGYSRDKLK